MKFNGQHTHKSGYKYLFVLQLVSALCLNTNLVDAKQSKPQDYKEARKPIKLNAAQLAAVAGKYQNMDNYITVTPAGGGIVLKMLLQGKSTAISFYPTDLHEFNTNYFGKPYWIIFSGSVRGKTPSFLTIEHDIWVRVK